MKQDPRAQIPGVDLSFGDGRYGRIWGVSGIDDLRGASFMKAASYLKQRAAQYGTFDWTIVVELDQVVSSAFKSLLNMMLALDDTVAENPDRRSILIEWHVRKEDDNMSSIADDVKDQTDQRASKLKREGIQIKIVGR